MIDNSNQEMHDLFEQRNIYLNPPADVDDQIKILRARGMVIDDYPYAKDFLEEVYFHRFISYSVPFFADTTSRLYKVNTNFKDVVKIYEFDSRLRNLLLEAIEKIEISVRTQFINLSWKYGPHFYMKHKLFRDHRLLNDSIEKLQYQIKASHDLLVSEYYHRYNDPEMPPVWIAIELTSIGQLSKWFMNLKSQEDKAAVAKRYRIHYSVLQAVLDNLTLIRNYAAHHNRIWNRNFSFECIVDDEHRAISQALCEGSRIYTVLVLILYVLKVLGFDEPFYKKLTGLIEIYSINVDAMGFPVNWKSLFQEVMSGK